LPPFWQIGSGSTMTKRLAVVAGPLVVLMLAFVAYTYLADRSTPAGQPALVEIDAQALEQIKEEFNRARGRVRVIALLSPT
jgi:hypothetical protein